MSQSPTDLPLQYNFVAPSQVIFGWGRRNELGAIAAALGQRVFIVSGSRRLEAAGRIGELASLLRSCGVETTLLATISREPLVEDVDQTTALLRAQGGGHGDVVVAIGGGSAIDLAKAVAAMVTNDCGATVSAAHWGEASVRQTSASDYLEGVGRGLKVIKPPLPVIAIPTTAGTGSEATKNAVISSFDPPWKKSLRSDLMVPQVALVDPELCCSLPSEVTIRTGMDAITQLIESYISCRARPIPKALAREGLGRAVPALAEAVENGGSRPGREAMSHAALLSGLALANSGLGIAHGVAAALGSVCRVPHGLACAVMLPVVLKVNREVCEPRYAELAESISPGPYKTPAAAAEAFVRTIDELVERLGVPRKLSQLGVRPEQIPDLVHCSQGNSMNGNPRPVSDEELTKVLNEMF